jgi:ketosteroid isomerase-like protein
MKILLNLFFCLLILNLYTYAQSKEEKEVASAVENLKTAMIEGNKQKLESIVSNDLSYGHSNGMIEDKNAFVETLASGKADFQTMDITDQKITISGNTALVRHNFTARIKEGENINNANLGILLVWQKQQGQWKLLARQAFKR